ncbi:MAG: hypothetical protein ABI721_04410 [Candidatus Dojkabacteria bacterium]
MEESLNRTESLGTDIKSIADFFANFMPLSETIYSFSAFTSLGVTDVERLKVICKDLLAKDESEDTVGFVREMLDTMYSKKWHDTLGKEISKDDDPQSF